MLEDEKKEESDDEFEIEAIVPKFESFEATAKADKLSRFVRLIYSTFMLQDKGTLPIKVCSKAYINTVWAGNRMKPSRETCRELLNEIVAICTNWISIKDIEGKEYVKLDRQALLSVVLV